MIAINTIFSLPTLLAPFLGGISGFFIAKNNNVLKNQKKLSAFNGAMIGSGIYFIINQFIRSQLEKETTRIARFQSRKNELNNLSDFVVGKDKDDENLIKNGFIPTSNEEKYSNLNTAKSYKNAFKTLKEMKEDYKEYSEWKKDFKTKEQATKEKTNAEKDVSKCETNVSNCEAKVSDLENQIKEALVNERQKEIDKLMRKVDFINDIKIDSNFNITLYRRTDYSLGQIKEIINNIGLDGIESTLGNHAYKVIKNIKNFKDKEKIININVELDKTSFSNGEKQIFIMALYKALMSLCRNEVPFVIDTPFARIDTEHRNNISKHFFKELKGQVFILSTNEEIEKKYIEYWDKIDILKRSIDTREENNKFVFYDGPATANEHPGLHHMLSKFLKDTFCKYKTMQGYQVYRKVGWDTHGLPVELQVEKELGFSGKGDIEKYGIEEFNQKCALIGTLGHKFSSEDVYMDAKHTTPQAPELQRTLDMINNEQIDYHKVIQFHFSLYLPKSSLLELLRGGIVR